MGKSEEIYWRAECSFADSHKHGMLAEIMSISWLEAVGLVSTFFCRVRRQMPDGDVSRITDKVLRLWTRSSKATMEALKGAGWVDPDGKVHGWDERYSEIALKRMAEKEKKRYQRAEDRRKLSGQIGDKCPDKNGTVSPNCPSNVPVVPPLHARAREGDGEGEGYELQTALVAVPAPTDRADELCAAWNQVAAELSLPVVRGPLSKPRKAAANARVRDGVLDSWPAICSALRSSPFYLGAGPARNGGKPWRADFDWLCTVDGWRKLLERADVGPPKAAVESVDEWYERVR